MRRSPLLRWLALAVGLFAAQCTGSLSEDCNKTLTCGSEPGVTLDASCVWRFADGSKWEEGPRKDVMGVWTWPDGTETDRQDYVCGGSADAGAEAGGSGPDCTDPGVGCDEPLVCDPASKRCVECLGIAECVGSTNASGAPATLCDPVSHTCTACLNDNDCAGTAATAFCKTVAGNAAANTCVACVRDNQCSGNTPACDERTNECTERCTADVDCSDSSKTVCINELCVQCGEDLQCAAFPDTLQCNMTTNRCVECLDNADCTLPEVCKTAANLCVQCLDNNHCGGTTPLCDTASNTCVACLDDGNCPAVGTSRCNRASHVCEPCNSNTQCEPGAPVCKTSTGTCVGCVETSDCAGQANAFCNTMDNVCVECLDDNQCLTPDAARCDLANNNILNNTCAGCDSNEECSGKGFGPLCRDPGGNGVCVACLTGAECQTDPALSRCDGTGVCAPCTNDDHCDLFTNLRACRINAAGNSCVECVNNTHCLTNATGRACKVNNTGTATGPAAVNTCVECISNADCTDPSASKCVQNECVPCAVNADCTQPGLSVCDLAGGADGGAPQCVQCTGPQRQACGAGANVCNSLTRLCTVIPVGDADSNCDECVSDAHCSANKRCVLHTFGTTSGHFCFPVNNPTCAASPFSVLTTGTIDSTTDTACLLRRTTCAAFLDFGLQACDDATDCGLINVDDGLCETDADLCSLPCTSGGDCAGGTCSGGICEL